MTNGELYDKLEQLGRLACLLWRVAPEDMKKKIAAETLPDFAVLAEEVSEYI